MTRYFQTVFFGLAAMLVFAGSANATSGPGCFQIVNVANNDVLNIRAEPNAGAKLTGTMMPREHGIIHGEGPCKPKAVALNQRWCPIIHYHGGGTTLGWVKRRYLRDSDCP